MPRNYYVYILASKRNGTLYIGVTNDLAPADAGDHKKCAARPHPLLTN